MSLHGLPHRSMARPAFFQASAAQRAAHMTISTRGLEIKRPTTFARPSVRSNSRSCCHSTEIPDLSADTRHGRFCLKPRSTPGFASRRRKTSTSNLGLDRRTTTARRSLIVHVYLGSHGSAAFPHEVARKSINIPVVINPTQQSGC